METVYKLGLEELVPHAFMILQGCFYKPLHKGSFLSFSRIERYGREVVEQLKSQGHQAVLFLCEDFTRDFFNKHGDVFGRGSRNDENGVVLKRNFNEDPALVSCFESRLSSTMLLALMSSPSVRDSLFITMPFPQEEGDWLRGLGFQVGVIAGLEFWQLNCPDGYMWVKRFGTREQGSVYAVTIETSSGHHSWIQEPKDMKKVMLDCWEWFVNKPGKRHVGNRQGAEMRYEQLKQKLQPIMDKVKEDYEKETV